MVFYNVIGECEQQDAHYISLGNLWLIQDNLNTLLGGSEGGCIGRAKQGNE